MRRLAVPALLALLLLTGCTGGAESGDQASSAAQDSAAGGSGGGGSAEAGGLAAAPAAFSTAGSPLAGRSVVRSGELRVTVRDAREAADRAATVVRGSGGVVAGEEAAEGRAVLRLRVPPARLDRALDQLADLGEEESRTLSSEDVTEQVVDLESRLATQRASVARVRALLDRASGLGDVVKVEGELAKREAELESLTARARTLADRVDLADVVLHLEEEDAVAAAAPGGFHDGLAAGWTAFTTSGRLLAAAVGALLPFLPVLAVVALLLRRRQRAAGQPVP